MRFTLIAFVLLTLGCSALTAAAPVLDAIVADAQRTAAEIQARRREARVEQLLREILATVDEVRLAQEVAAEATEEQHAEVIREVRRGWVRLDGLLVRLEAERVREP